MLFDPCRQIMAALRPVRIVQDCEIVIKGVDLGT